MNRFFQLAYALAIPMMLVASGFSNYEATISRAVSESKVQQKDLFLYFTASDCERCKTMDKYFDNPIVQDAIDERYVSAKVDIKAFDGRACSEIYEVRSVPALVVVTPTGQIKHKQVGALDIEEMDLLISGQISYRIDVDEPVSREEKKEATPDYVLPSGKYSIQIGFFSSKANADKMITKAKNQGFSQTVALEESRDNKKFYRVLVGSYNSEEEAANTKKLIASSGIDAKVHVRVP